MNHKLNLKKQLACIYTNNFFSGLRITDAVWVALLAARGFSLWEIGVAESVFHMVSLTFEVPSGMAADLLGRKKTLVAGGVCMVLSNLLMAFAPDLFFICLAMALSALANAMFSGTASALTYDSLKQCGRTDDYLRVSANCSQLSMLATAVGSLASTLERFLRFSGFYLLSAAFEGTAAAATALMTEPIVTETQARREKQTFRDLPGQLARLARDSITALRATPLAAKLIVSAAVLCIPSYLTKMFVQQRLVELGWPTALLFVPLKRPGGSIRRACGGFTPSAPCSAAGAARWWVPPRCWAASSAVCWCRASSTPTSCMRTRSSTMSSPATSVPPSSAWTAWSTACS